MSSHNFIGLMLRVRLLQLHDVSKVGQSLGL